MSSISLQISKKKKKNQKPKSLSIFLLFDMTKNIFSFSLQKNNLHILSFFVCIYKEKKKSPQNIIAFIFCVKQS